MARRRPLLPSTLPESPAIDTPPEPAPPVARPRTRAQNSKIPVGLHAELHRVSKKTGINISKIIADGIRIRLDQLARAMSRADA